MKGAIASMDVDIRSPIRGTLFGCCASTGKLSAKSIVPRASHLRFRIVRFGSPRQAGGLSLSKAVQVSNFRLWERELRNRIANFLSIGLSSQSKIVQSKSTHFFDKNAFASLISGRSVSAFLASTRSFS